MFEAWIVLFLLLTGAQSFLIHNTHRGLCLEDSGPPGQVLLKTCDLDSASQQWVWLDRGLLMCVASSRCLSARHRDPVQTRSCFDEDVEGLVWDCDGDRLVSRDTSMLLSIKGRRLTLSQHGKHSKWRSLDEGDICQEKLRARRASDEPDHFEFAEQKGEAMTEEEREYLRWFYRTEDSTIWKFVLLGLSFVCLLVGFLLLGMGAMSSRNRKKIAKYKAAAALAHKSEVEELRVVFQHGADGPGTPSPERPPQETKASPSNGKVRELEDGDIVVTWKDGNTSCLYPEPAAKPAEEEEEEEEEEEQAEKQEEVSATDVDAHEEDETMK